MSGYADPPKETQFKPGVSGNPKGKPKGTKHISTWIQEMLNDEEFETMILDSKKGMIEFKGAPLKAIIMVAMRKAITDPKTGTQWAEWLAKHGYGTKVNIGMEDPIRLIVDKYGGGGEVDLSTAQATENRPSTDKP